MGGETLNPPKTLETIDIPAPQERVTPPEAPSHLTESVAQKAERLIDEHDVNREILQDATHTLTEFGSFDLDRLTDTDFRSTIEAFADLKTFAEERLGPEAANELTQTIARELHTLEGFDDFVDDLMDDGNISDPALMESLFDADPTDPRLQFIQSQLGLANAGGSFVNAFTRGYGGDVDENGNPKRNSVVDTLQTLSTIDAATREAANTTMNKYQAFINNQLQKYKGAETDEEKALILQSTHDFLTKKIMEENPEMDEQTASKLARDRVKADLEQMYIKDGLEPAEAAARAETEVDKYLDEFAANPEAVTIYSDIADIEAKIADLQQKRSDLAGEINLNKYFADEIYALQQQKEELEKQLDGLDDGLAKDLLTSNSEDLSAQLNELNAQITTAQDEKSKLENDLEAAKLHAAAMDNQYNTEFDNAAHIVEDYTDLEAQLVTINVDIPNDPYASAGLSHVVYQDENGEYYIKDGNGNPVFVKDLENADELIADIEAQRKETAEDVFTDENGITPTHALKVLGSDDPQLAAKHEAAKGAFYKSQQEFSKTADDAAAADATVKELEDAIAKKQEEIDRLEAEKLALENRIGEIDATVAANNAEIAALQKQLDANATATDAAKTELAKLQQELDTLEAEKTAQEQDMLTKAGVPADKQDAFLAEVQKSAESGQCRVDSVFNTSSFDLKNPDSLLPGHSETINENTRLQMLVDTYGAGTEGKNLVALNKKIDNLHTEIANAGSTTGTAVETADNMSLKAASPEEMARHAQMLNDARNYADQIKVNPSVAQSDFDAITDGMTDKQKEEFVAEVQTIVPAFKVVQDYGIETDKTPEPEVEVAANTPDSDVNYNNNSPPLQTFGI